MTIGAWSFKEGKYITEYEGVIASKLANVMAGGDLSRPTWVSEQYILDLECEAFLSLCGEEKTQARMFNMLQTGKAVAELGGATMTHEAVIVTALRTPVGKAKRGGLATVRPDELAAAVMKALLTRTPGLDPKEVDDVILGCAFPEGEQGLNMARMIALRAGLPDSVPGETINRYCSSGVQSIAHAAYAIQCRADGYCHCRRGRIDEHGADDGL